MGRYQLIHKHTKIGTNAQIGAFVCIGINRSELSTIIGNNSIIRSHTIVYGGNTIGENFQTGHSVLIRELNTIGNNVSIGSHSVIEHHVRVGNNVRIHSNVFIPEYTILEDDVWIGPNVVLTNSRYPKSPLAKQQLTGPIIKRKAKIGANATVLPGIEIGENALMGAGSVVTSDVPPNAVVVGNPARVINSIDNLPYV